MQKIKEALKPAFADMKVRFLFVGVLNTAVGYGLYALCIYMGMHYALAQLVSSVIAIAHSYLWNKYFTFRTPDKSMKELFRFLAVYLAGYLLNLLILFICITLLKMNSYLGGILGLAVTTLLSYFGHKTFSFKTHKAKERV